MGSRHSPPFEGGAAFAWEALENFAYFDSEVVREIEQRGKPVRVAETARIVADVKVIPAP